jgi:prephenate dehydrogenase
MASQNPTIPTDPALPGQKTVGVLGLGLIGGSLAKAYAAAGWRVLAFDTSADALGAARVETIAGVMDEATVPACDLILLAIYPGGCVEWLRANAHLVRADALVVDCCGVKREVCDACLPLAAEHGFTFVGGHPMAGTQYSGFAHARATLFKGAPMVIVPPRTDDMALLDRIACALEPAGFGSICVSTADEHDRRIAYTSQLAHVVSNAYVKSPTAQGHQGFSAGSYRDLTRVARLNEHMWCELFLDDADNLLFELDTIIANLGAYRDALAARDAQTLTELLAEGRRAKEAAEKTAERKGERP